MKQITLGSTGICVPQNAFGALPIQRISDEAAVQLLRNAHDGGMTFFDTARAYSDSEEKLGIAFSTVRGGRIDSSRVRHIPIENCCPPWNMRLYWRKDRPLTEDEATFKAFVENFYREP